MGPGIFLTAANGQMDRRGLGGRGRLLTCILFILGMHLIYFVRWRPAPGASSESADDDRQSFNVLTKT